MTKATKREFLAGAASAALIAANPAMSASLRMYGASNIMPAPPGWSTLKIGAGGLIIGFDFADDKMMCCRCDTFNCYIWADENGNPATYETVNNPANYWKPLITLASMIDACPAGVDLETQPIISNGLGGYDLCFAPSNSNRMLLITADCTSFASGANYSGVYISNDAGTTWTLVNDVTNFPHFANAVSNGNFNERFARNKLAIDPNNQDIMYCGMPYQSGNTYPVYRSTDGGVTWDGTWCSGEIADITANPGALCIVFDRNRGTVSAFGKTVSKRMMIGVSNVGMYETMDGGMNFTLTTGGPTNFQTQTMDYDGRTYVSQFDGTKLWRYDPAATAGAGTWFEISTGSNFPPHAFGQEIRQIACDPRNGGQGKLWLTAQILTGWYSANAQNATVDNITWAGNVLPISGSGWNAAPNDLPWSQATRTGGISAATRIDANGIFWQCGTQNFWYMDMPIYGNAGVPIADVGNSVGRGIEQTVTAAILRAPGSPYVLAAMLDVGLYRKSQVSVYPSVAEWVWTGAVIEDRSDCTGLDFVRSNPNFVVGRMQKSGWSGSVYASQLSAYSSDQGVTWTRYATMPDPLYPGDDVNGGYILAFDEDRHICFTGDTAANVPAYTLAARDPSDCNWTLSTDLPSIIWLGSGGPPPYKNTHPVDVDWVTPGVAYAYQWEVGLASPTGHVGDIWKTTNYGVNWSIVGNRSLGVGENRPFLYTVPDNAGHFYLGTASSSSSTLYKTTNSGASFSTIPFPSGITSIYKYALGAPKPATAYPCTLYLLGWTGFSSQYSLWRSDKGDGTDWVEFGSPLQSQLPAISQLDAPNTFIGDWVQYGRVYLGMVGSGFNVFSL